MAKFKQADEKSECTTSTTSMGTSGTRAKAFAGLGGLLGAADGRAARTHRMEDAEDHYSRSRPASRMPTVDANNHLFKPKGVDILGNENAKIDNATCLRKPQSRPPSTRPHRSWTWSSYADYAKLVRHQDWMAYRPHCNEQRMWQDTRSTSS